MSSHRSFAALVAAALFIAGGSYAYTRTEAPASVVFHGVGPAGFKIEGKGSNVTVKEDAKTVTIVVGLKEMTTGISLRDRHMREKYLEVEKFPETTLAVDKASLQATGADVKTKGTVSLHGKSLERPFSYKAKCNGDICDVTGSIGLNMNDFGIVVPVYLGVTMKPDVTIDVSFQIKK